MFDFIWHLRGSVPLGGISSNERILDSVERLLVRQRKGVSERGTDFLAFDEPLWSNLVGSNWLAMVTYDRGRFWVKQSLGGRRLRYDLRSLHLMVFCLFVAFMASLFGLAGEGLLGGLKIGVGAFGWLYGMNFLLALVRIPSTVRKAVTRA